MTAGDDQCEVCGASSTGLRVASLPGIPMSVASCPACISAGAIPYDLAVANTAALGGLQHAAQWWHGVVQDTITHLGISWEGFYDDVAMELQYEREAHRDVAELDLDQ